MHILTDDVVRQLMEGLTTIIDTVRGVTDKTPVGPPCCRIARDAHKLRALLPDFDHPKVPTMAQIEAGNRLSVFIDSLPAQEGKQGAVLALKVLRGVP